MEEARELDEHFVELPPELCCLKILGFSKYIGSSLSLLPSLMHRLENLLVAIELKNVFSQSFAEGGEVTAYRVLEAITTEKCMERFSLERLEVLGDAFLKYAVGRHVFLAHGSIDEGQLTRKRSSIVNNSHLYKLAIRSNLQVYIRDENFDPSQFFALGRPCTVICDKSTERSIHLTERSECIQNRAESSNVKCNKGHLWLHKKTIADIVEALIGAFIVDSGFKAAIAFLRWIGIEVDLEASQISDICLASKSYLSLSNKIDVSALEKSLDHKFLHKGLLVQAFVHPSFNRHIGGCYQRLEFLGDAVLDYLITSYLFSVYPKLKPGQLTDLRSVLVNNNVFANVAVCRSFHTYIISDSDALSEAVQKFVSYFRTRPVKQGVIEGPRCPKALGDLVESIVGAILLDTGFDLNMVWRVMLSFLDPIMTFSTLQLNPVRELTELCQSRNWEFKNSLYKKGGSFSVDAHVIGSSVNCKGSGTNLSKKAALRTAAVEIFSKLKAQGYMPKKSNSLEHLLKSSEKMEAKLIGYDETPTPADFVVDIVLENLIIQETSPNSGEHSLDSKSAKKEPASIHPFSRRTISKAEEPEKHDPENIQIKESHPAYHVRTLNTQTFNKEPAPIPPFTRRTTLITEAPGKQHSGVTKDNGLVANSGKGGMLPQLSAKSRLYEICAACSWEAPIFECVREEGQSHMKLFSLKVTVEIPDVPCSVVECFSDPQPKKKAAEECAAEGALWYLKQQGFLDKDK